MRLNANARRGQLGSVTIVTLAAALALADGALALSPEESAKIEAAIPAEPRVKPKEPRRVLVCSRTFGFRHSCIPYASKTLELMAGKTGAFAADFSDEMSAFAPENLAKYDAVILNNTTRLKFDDPSHQQALLDFVRGGKGLVGLHAAADNFYDWPAGVQMIGGLFDGHPWGAGGTWAFALDDPQNALNRAFDGKGFKVSDEIYQFKEYSRTNLHVLVKLDMDDAATTQPKGKRADKDYAVSWVRREGSGRVFVYGFGHNHPIFWNPPLLQHLLDGIQYALGDLKADDAPSAK